MRKITFVLTVLALFSSCGSAEAGCRLFGGRFSRPAQGSCQSQQANPACATCPAAAVPQTVYVVRPPVAAPYNPPVYSTVIRGGDCPNGQCPNARR